MINLAESVKRMSRKRTDSESLEGLTKQSIETLEVQRSTSFVIVSDEQIVESLPGKAQAPNRRFPLTS